MSKLAALLATRVVVADGAMATQLQERGLPVGEASDLWSLTYPDRVRAVHESYRDAGCDVLTTNSFGANRWALEHLGVTAAVDELNRAAAAIARSVAAPGNIVLGDIGPSGVLLEPFGPATLEEWRREYRRQAAALLAGGADGVAIETMSDLQEAVAAVEGAREAGAADILACMTFGRLPNGRLRTLQGQSPEETAASLAAAGATVVGGNCGTRMSLDDVAEMVALMRAAAPVPIAALPNAGLPRVVGSRAVYDLDPAAFGDGMRAVIGAGARLVGGCCGTTPAHMAALRRLVASRGSAGPG